VKIAFEINKMEVPHWARATARGNWPFDCTKNGTMPAALQHSDHADTQVAVLGEAESRLSISADELCDELLAHTFECDACINNLEAAAFSAGCGTGLPLPAARENPPSWLSRS